MVWIGVTLLMALIVISSLRLGGGGAPRSEDEDDVSNPPPSGFDTRVDRLIGLLNYADSQGAANATRQLLSMGPGILPILFAHLARLEHHPDGISPRCQRMIEELLVDFGLQTYLQGGDFVQSIHRASPILPSVLRVLETIGPNVLVEVARGPLLDPVTLLAPLLKHLGSAAQDPIAELLRNKAHDVPKALLETSLILLTEHPEVVRVWYREASSHGRILLLDSLLGWKTAARDVLLQEALQDADIACRALALKEHLFGLLSDPSTHTDARALLVRCAQEPTFAALLASSWQRLQDPPTHESQTDTDPWAVLFWGAAFLGPQDLRDLLTSCLSEDAHDVYTSLLSLPNEVDTRTHTTRILQLLDSPIHTDQIVALCALQTLLGDPRTAPRLLTHAQDPAAPYGSLALSLVASTSTADALTQALQRRMRAASPSACEHFFLRLSSCLVSETFQPTLLRLLRSESPRLVPLSARLLAFTSPPVSGVLQALGRHRYSPLERSVFPLLWAQWDQLGAHVQRSLSSTNRPEREAALDVLALLGSEDDIPALITSLDTHPEDLEATLNVLEMIGAASCEPLQEWTQSSKGLQQQSQTQRRLALLKLLTPKNTQDAP